MSTTLKGIVATGFIRPSWGGEPIKVRVKKMNPKGNVMGYPYRVLADKKGVIIFGNGRWAGGYSCYHSMDIPENFKTKNACWGAMVESEERYLRSLRLEAVNVLARLRYNIKTLAAMKRGKIIPHFSHVKDREEKSAEKIISKIVV